MSKIFRKIIYPAWHWAKMDGVNRAHKELEENQWMSPAELQELQARKLKRLLEVAAADIPYYQKVIDGSYSIDDAFSPEFRALPQLSKAIIREEKNALTSRNLGRNTLVKNSTSGSTGESTHFFTDSYSIPYRKAAATRSDQWTGWRLGDRGIRLWGARIDQDFATGLRGKLHGLVSNNRFLSSFELSEQRMDEYISAVIRFRPVLLTAYAGSLEIFAKHCEERKVKFPSLKGIVSSAETLWPHQRALAESAFEVKVFDRYGSREVGQIAAECEYGNGLHVSVDRMIVEIISDSGEPCMPGEEGKILVTDLDNYGMPLIRYDIGDRGVMSKFSRCECGRGLPLLEKVSGRTLEIVRTRDGKKIGGTFWTLLFKSRPGIRQFQVVQNEVEGVLIRYVADGSLPVKSRDIFRKKIQEKCGDDFVIEFESVSHIERSKSGKHRIIVSRITE